jgi:cephalosporin-C deacetylase
MRKHAICLLLFLVCAFPAFMAAQPVEQLIKVVVAPDHSNWTYKTGEPVKFSIAVLQDGNPVKNATIYYELGPEKMHPSKKDSLVLTDGKITLDAGTMKTAGFMRCAVVAKFNGKEYRKIATAGFDPLNIKPTVTEPADFDAFWTNAKQELSAMPLGTKMTLLPERCTETVDVYHVSVQNVAGSGLIYGILCLPKKPGKYPALLRVPGAGVRPYGGNIAMAEKGMITLEIGIHGIPVNLDPAVYTNLGSAALNGYPYYNMDNRDKFYYKKVYLGCVRANDLLVSLPQYDGSTLAVTGGSQGGALSIVTAALDPRVKFLAAYYPALADVTGYLHGRAGGWPHYFDRNNAPANDKKDKIETICYYDVVNFSRRVKIPGIYSWGYNDEVCPPTSMYASYNVIAAPKTIFLVPETGHWTYPEQGETLNNWLIEKMNLKPSR